MQNENVTLRSLDMSDVPLLHEFVKDKDVVQYSLSKWQNDYTEEEFAIWFENTINDPTVINFAIELPDSKKFIGYAGFCELPADDLKIKTAEYFIFIGDKTEWGKGYGTNVTKLITQYGFEKLNLDSIFLTVSEANIAGVKAYEKAGYVQTGTIAYVSKSDGKPKEKIRMEIFRPT